MKCPNKLRKMFRPSSEYTSMFGYRYKNFKRCEVCNRFYLDYKYNTDNGLRQYFEHHCKYTGI